MCVTWGSMDFSKDTNAFDRAKKLAGVTDVSKLSPKQLGDLLALAQEVKNGNVNPAL